MIGIDEFHELGLRETIALIRERVGDAPLYVTIDLDVLDPSVAPAVSNMEPGYTGFMMSEATGLLQGLRGLDVIGADVVCLMPTKDNPNHITAMNAMVLVFEQISLIADSVQRRAARTRS